MVSSFLILPLLIFISIFYTLYLYKLKAPSVPGPSFVWPIAGQLVEVVRKPYQFWINQEAFGPISKNFLGGRLVIFSAKSEYTNQIFKKNTGENLRIVIGLNDSVFSNQNISCLHGSEHTTLRKSLLTLFTRKKLNAYITTQEGIIRNTMKSWLQLYQSKEIDMRTLARNLNINTSLRVLLGTYATESYIQLLSKLFFEVNSGLIAMPIYFPGTELWTAVHSRTKLMTLLKDLVRKAHSDFITTKDTNSILYQLLDNVITNLSNSGNYEKNNIPQIPESGPYSVDKVANVVLNLMFASQDASTSSVVWSVVLLDKNRDVLAKIREEQEKIRPNNETITHDLLDNMTYTTMVVKEILRYRPPAIMVPHETKQEFEIDGIKIPKGTFLMPSIFSATNQGFSEPEKFNPERFNEDNQEHIKYSQNYLVFGTGPHSCIGREYAINQLKVFISLFVSTLDVKRRFTEKSEDIVLGPTTFPADGCLITFSPYVK